MKIGQFVMWKPPHELLHSGVLRAFLEGRFDLLRFELVLGSPGCLDESVILGPHPQTYVIHYGGQGPGCRAYKIVPTRGHLILFI